MDKKKDIFDRIMELPILRYFNPIYVKYKEVLLYLFFGGLTTIISIFTFWVFNIKFDMNVLVANVLSWFIAVLFAFFTNRVWVFTSKTNSVIEFAKQMVSFFGARVATLVVEQMILFIFVTKMGYSSIAVKIIAQIIVVILNYITSKLIVFKN